MLKSILTRCWRFSKMRFRRYGIASGITFTSTIGDPISKKLSFAFRISRNSPNSRISTAGSFLVKTENDDGNGHLSILNFNSFWIGKIWFKVGIKLKMLSFSSGFEHVTRTLFLSISLVTLTKSREYNDFVQEKSMTSLFFSSDRSRQRQRPILKLGQEKSENTNWIIKQTHREVFTDTITNVFESVSTLFLELFVLILC